MVFGHYSFFEEDKVKVKETGDVGYIFHRRWSLFSLKHLKFFPRYYSVEFDSFLYDLPNMEYLESELESIPYGFDSDSDEVSGPFPESDFSLPSRSPKNSLVDIVS